MKKILSIGIAIVMLFAVVVLGACNNDAYPRPNLNINAELELSIRQSFATRNNIAVDDAFILFYYGTFNEISIVLIGSTEFVGGDTQTTVVISGIEFIFSTTTIFSAWRNDDFYSVQQVYNNGWLTRSMLRTIREIHLEKQ
jgi:hypothetical protein